MKKYFVTVPISGYASIEVEANTEEEAINKAINSNDLNLGNIAEWDAHAHINEGNVCNAILWNAVAEEIED